MNICDLSDKLILEIFSYLQLNDVLSCCQVNIRWRNILNQDKIWSNLCLRKYHMHETFSYPLEKPPPLVNQICIPENKSKDLTEVCPWRLRFIQEVQITKNWMNGTYVSFPISEAQFTDIECEDDLMVALDQSENFFTVYNIFSMPVKIQSLQLPVSRRADLFKLRNKKLIFCHMSLVHVYTKQQHNDAFDLTHRFLFDKSEEYSKNMIPPYEDITDWFDNYFGYNRKEAIDFEHIVDYFIGWTRLSGNVVFHIWDLNVGNKIVEQSLPLSNIVKCDFSHVDSYLYISILFSSNNINSACILCFSLINFEFTNFKIEFQTPSIYTFLNRFFIICLVDHDKNVLLFSRKDGTLMQKITCEFNVYSIASSSSYLTLAEFTGFNMKVFNTRTLQSVSIFQTDFHIIDTRFVSPEIILLCGYDFKLEIWNVLTKSALTALEGECLWISPCRSKLIIADKSNKLVVLHFW